MSAKETAAAAAEEPAAATEPQDEPEAAEAPGEAQDDDAAEADPGHAVVVTTLPIDRDGAVIPAGETLHLPDDEHLADLIRAGAVERQ